MSRIQNRNLSLGYDGSCRYFNAYDSSIQERSYSPSIVSLPISVRDDIRRSTFDSIGWRPPQPYKASFTELGDVTAVWDSRLAVNNGSWEEYVISYSSYWNPPSRDLMPTVSSQARNRAIVSMLNKLADNKMELGVSLLEARESVDMIGRSARSLATAMAAASRKDWRAVARALAVPLSAVKNGSSVSSGWLGYQFGWKPLIDDIAKGCSLLAEPQLALKSRIRVASGNKSNEIRSQNSKSFDAGPFSAADPYKRFVFSYDETVRTQVDYKVSCYYHLEEDKLRSLSQLGLINPAAIAWAVVPFSFVADWVLPIGDILKSLTADVGLTYVGGSETSFRAVHRDIKLRGVRPVFDNDRVAVRSRMFSSATGSKVKDMDRQVLSSSPLPSGLYLKDPFDAWKAVTSIALLRQFSSHKSST